MKIHNSLLMFLFFLCLGTQMSAQTGNTKNEITTWTLIEDSFFIAFPESIKDKMHSISFVTIEAGRVMLINLITDETLSEEEKSRAIAIEEVPGGKELLHILKQGQAGSPLLKPSALKAGDLIPDFSAIDTKGTLWNKERMRGRPTVLNFWHIGCGPCIREMPELNEWMKEVPEVNYLSVTGNTARQIERIVNETPFLFHHLADNLFLYQLFAVQITPTTVLLDKSGVIQEIVVGTSEQKRAHLLSRIKELSIE